MVYIHTHTYTSAMQDKQLNAGVKLLELAVKSFQLHGAFLKPLKIQQQLQRFNHPQRLLHNIRSKQCYVVAMLLNYVTLSEGPAKL